MSQPTTETQALDKEEKISFGTILAQYFVPPPEGPEWTVSTGASGMNNTTRYVERAGERYVLRIYETHRDEDKVTYEHHVLDCLEQSPVPGIPTPSPVRARHGSTIVRTSDGKLAALFHHREGQNPELMTEADFHHFGRAAGALSLAMSRLTPDHAPLYRPYYELCLPDPEEQRQVLFAPLHATDSIVADMQDALMAVEAGMEQVHRKLPLLQKLPHQLIHGDLNASNVLADQNNRITALLDFEFVAWDLRVMELAVCLSEAAENSDEGPSENPSKNLSENLSKASKGLRALVRGFLEQVPLSPEELAVLPDLLLLRRLDVFIHFLNRWRNGVDSPQTVRRFLSEVLSQTVWLSKNSEILSPFQS